MNLHKAELKTVLLREYRDKANNLGIQADDEMLRLEGSIGALQLAAKTLETNKGFYRKQLQDEELTQDEYAMVCKAVDRDIGALVSMVNTITVEKQRKEGELLAFKRVTELMEKDHEREMDKLKQFQQAMAEGGIKVEDDGTLRPPGLNIVSDLEQRRKAAQEAKQTISQSEVPSTVETPQKASEESQEAESKPKVAKKTARKKVAKKKATRKKVAKAAEPAKAEDDSVKLKNAAPNSAADRAAGARKPSPGARKRQRV